MAPKKRGKPLKTSADIPPPKVPEELLRWPKHIAKYDPSDAFQKLKHTDAAVRLAGAKWIAKRAHGTVNNFTEYWLKDPGTMDRLLEALYDPDPLVVEELIGAVHMIVTPRYRSDDRAIPRAIELLRSDRRNTRLRAAMLLTNFTDERLADALLPMFNDPDKAVRAIIIQEIASPAYEWPAPLQERVRQAALERLNDRTMDVRVAVAKLLITVGRAEDVKTLKKAYPAIKGFNYRQDFRESIQILEQNLRAEASARA